MICADDLNTRLSASRSAVMKAATGKVQHVEMKDEVPTGSIVINKDGEFVTDTTLMKGYWYDFIFNFFKDSLAGVTFDVYAKEDIVSADGLDTVYHKAGDKVATIVTNDKGIARIDDLPLGYTVKRIGKYHTLKEMDSIRIYNRSHWYRWSRQFDKGNNGGSQIDFLRVFCGMSVKEAVFWLLDFAGYRRIENPVKQPLVHQVSQKQTEERKPFVLPEPAGDNSYLISYLNQERGISRVVIDLFLKDGLIYESRHYHNVVFRGNDKNGVTRFASMRGVFDKQGKPFKCDVTGNDKNYGFNVVNENSTELVVFEAAIDLMSYVDIFTDYESNKLALGMLADAPLETFLREHPQITSIRFCLDGDEPGRKAAAEGRHDFSY